MPTRNAKPFIWSPVGCTDSTDGAEAFPGAMQQLSDLVPSLRTSHHWWARPPAALIATLSGGNFISAMIEREAILYGMIANGAGQDIPFAYNLGSNTVLSVAGVNVGVNTPNSAPSTGDWVPPIMAQVGSRIVVTHTGFQNGTINDARAHTFLGKATLSSTTLLGALTLTQPGDSLFGTSLASGSVANSVFNGFQGQSTASASGTIGQSTFTIGAFSGNPPVAGNALVSTDLQVVGLVTTYSSGSGIVGYTGVNKQTFSGATITWLGTTIVMNHAATASSGNFGEPINSLGTGTSTGAGYKFGWFDISGASVPLPANLSNTSPVINLASAFGIQPGMTVTGTGIPANTTLLNLSLPSLTFTGQPPNFGDTALVIQATSSQTLPAQGATASGPGLIPGTQVSGVPTIIGYSQGVSFTVSVPISFPAAGTVGLNSGTYVFTGLVAGILSNAATVTGTETLTFGGGTTTAPRWGAGDLAYNPLPQVPFGVAELNARAYFACGTNGYVFSDSGLPAARTNASQAVVPEDGRSVTAIAGLPLLSPITGGIVQSIIGFARVHLMHQITGDQATGNLSINTMNVATGTLAPLSVFPTTLGLAFISPEGLRFVTQQGTITDALNANNERGIAFPFVNVTIPSRICGAANSDVIRYSVTQGGVDQEWVYYISLKKWVGPHTWVSSLIIPRLTTFISSPKSVQGNAVTLGTIWNANLFPVYASPPTYTEDGFAMHFVFETALLPDSPEQNSYAVDEAFIWYTQNAGAGNSATIQAIDEAGNVLDTVTLTPTSQTDMIRMMPLDHQWVFRQLVVKVTGNLDQLLVLGRIGLRYLQLEYERYLP